MLNLNCKHVQHVKTCLPCNFEVNPVTHFGVISRSLNLTFISNSFWNKGGKVLKCWKFYEKREITPKWVTGFTSKLHGRQILTCWTCLPCNFEVNFITYFGVITLFSSNFQHFNTFHPLFQKLLEMQILTCWTCLQFKFNIYP
jgi:hypothetical protein